MKYIKQISTGKILHRENPHTDKTLENASSEHNIDKVDLEVVEENWTEDEWNSAMHNQLGYADKRKESYPPATDYLDGVVKGDQAQIDKYVSDCLAVKQRFPK